MDKFNMFQPDLVIAARPAGGFRRCGVHHTPEQKRHPAGTFTPEQIEQLMAEPNLLVVAVDPQPAEGGEEKPGGKAKGPAAKAPAD
ncbi:MAG TPA: HI1506-related protein [Azospirillum sp.]|nr:HI1506-related protein [Azospirillum sp.]